MIRAACAFVLLGVVAASTSYALSLGWADRYVAGVATNVYHPNSTPTISVFSPYNGDHSFCDLGMQHRGQAYNAVTQVSWHHANRVQAITPVVFETWAWRYRATTAGMNHSWGDACSSFSFGPTAADGSAYRIDDNSAWQYPHDGSRTSGYPSHLEIAHDQKSPNVSYTGALGSPSVHWEYIVQIYSRSMTAGVAALDFGCYRIYWTH